VDRSEANQLEKRLTSLLLADQDMLEVMVAAGTLLKGVESASLRAVLETGMVVSYARAFTPSNYFVKLDGDEYRPDDSSLAGIHDLLLLTRSKRYAHNDKESGRGIALFLGTGNSGGLIRWSRELLPSDRFDEVIALCHTQRDRFLDEARAIRANLDAHSYVAELGTGFGTHLS
jgi:hypothetical protein